MYTGIQIPLADTLSLGPQTQRYIGFQKTQSYVPALFYGPLGVSVCRLSFFSRKLFLFAEEKDSAVKTEFTGRLLL